ncbi:SPOR domain-containing protein [Mesorhizobium sp. SB112]|uniref:SPOR domain-containing protein n=1 Tax=Mesorhizobium sp. SB112 TaxID=3151853 RepID=UPI0032633597
MAERNNLRIADRGEVSNEDPFAELTRIMGFDPRQPVGSENEVAAQSASADHLGEDDFSIDLEKELLGEFSLEDDASEQPYEAAAYEPVAPEPASTVTDQPFEQDYAPVAHEYSEDELAASFEQEFAVDTSWQPQPADAQPYAESAEVEAVSYGQEGEDFSSDFDSALAEVDMDFGSSLPPFESSAELEPAEIETEDHYQVEAPAPVAAAPAAELSLEDELNALLGNMDPASSPQPASVEYNAPEAVAPEPVQAFDPAEMNFSEDDLAFDEPSLEVSHFEAPQEQPVYASSHYEDDAVAEQEQDFAYEAEDQPVVEEAANFEHANYVDYSASTQPEPAFDAQEAVEASEVDPLEELAALTNYTPQDTHVWSRQTPTQYYNEPQAEEPVAEAAVAETAHYVDEQDDVAPVAATSDAGIPDIETIDVPEQAIALADDLDLPELAHEEDVPSAAAYDDLDAEFANLLNDMNPSEPEAPAATAAAETDALDDFGSDFDLTLDDDAQAAPASQYGYAAAGVAAGVGAYAAGNAYARANQTAPAAGTPADPYANFATDDFFGGNSSNGYQQGAADDLGYDPSLDEEMALPEYQEVRQEPKRRGLMIAALVGGVAILGGVGALAFSFGGGSGSDAPAIVRADDSPIKVRPENPGGTTIPNQDSKVYESVARSGPPSETPANTGPAQEQLVTTAEEPVDITARANEEANDAMPLGDDENLPGVAMKSEDRLQPTQAGADNTAANEVAAVAPRKVRTMVVRPDGSLVPREEPAAAPAQTADTASEGVLAPVASTGETTASTGPALAPQPSNNAPSAMPSTMEAAPSRPANQPVNVVGEVQPQQVAAAAPAAGAAAGAWAMQIASQPSEAAAQSSYQDLSRRYSSVLNGRQPSIVKAEIAGKGTFWRVRIPAQTRNEAVTLCESYKAAGGNCFVSR